MEQIKTQIIEHLLTLTIILLYFFFLIMSQHDDCITYQILAVLDLYMNFIQACLEYLQQPIHYWNQW